MLSGLIHEPPRFSSYPLPQARVAQGTFAPSYPKPSQGGSPLNTHDFDNRRSSFTSFLPAFSSTTDDTPLHLREYGKRSDDLAGINEELKERLKKEIDVASDSIEDSTAKELLRTICNEILRVFDRLALIESNLQKLDTLLENLSILELLQFEIRFMVTFIEAEAMYTAGVGQRLRDTFDGVSYGISHDVKRVFEREITTEIRSQTTPVVYGKIFHSHGLLSNCFQQTFITLLQTSNPQLDPLRLFNGFEERLRQSLLLSNELTTLMRLVKKAQEQNSAEALQAVMAKAIEFRDGAMQYLMYRDWRGYEHHVATIVTAIQNDLDATKLLHQFACYLEILYGHVKMRSVFREIYQDPIESAA